MMNIYLRPLKYPTPRLSCTRLIIIKLCKILTFTKKVLILLYFNFRYLNRVYCELFTSPKGVKNWMTLQDLDSPVRTMAPVTARTLPLWFQQQQTAEMPVSNTTGSVTGQNAFLIQDLKNLVNFKSNSNSLYYNNTNNRIMHQFTENKLEKLPCKTILRVQEHFLFS